MLWVPRLIYLGGKRGISDWSSSPSSAISGVIVKVSAQLPIWSPKRDKVTWNGTDKRPNLRATNGRKASRTAAPTRDGQILSPFFPFFCQRGILTLSLPIRLSLLTIQVNSVSTDAGVNRKQTDIPFNSLSLSLLLFNSCQLVSEFFPSLLVRNLPSEKERVTVQNHV